MNLPKLYFVVPSDVYQTYRCQPYHAKDGKLFKGRLGNVREVKQWALMIPTGAEKPARDKDKEQPAGTKRRVLVRVSSVKLEDISGVLESKVVSVLDSKPYA
ncbi:hypothetical protein H4Q26_013818 [Puccinia striiformis f. sp. tritici PST-130]|nr:hypothetical protein H4Q26_013818 [Puccinia striiformis f. sp. tritici PST-130]